MGSSLSLALSHVMDKAAMAASAIKASLDPAEDVENVVDTVHATSTSASRSARLRQVRTKKAAKSVEASFVDKLSRIPLGNYNSRSTIASNDKDQLPINLISFERVSDVSRPLLLHIINLLTLILVPLIS